MEQSTVRKPPFNETQLLQLAESFEKVQMEYQQILERILRLKPSNLKSKEHIQHGFLRRVKTLKRCIDNIWLICPPETAFPPTNDALTDLDINLQAFVFNTFGCVDNLAWIWVHETNHVFKRNTDVSFDKFKTRMSQDFQVYLKTRVAWFKYQSEYRHALAHRIPLYVPPRGFTKIEETQFNELEEAKWTALFKGRVDEVDNISLAQDSLGIFSPVMMHSYNENAKAMLFHAQSLSDWATIMELAEKLLKEVRL